MRRDSVWKSLRMPISTLLTCLLIAGAPGIALSRSETGAPATLTVASNPAGAMVYVNGVARGATPLEIEEIEAGDHRITLLKDGYLENNRMVSVKAGETASVEVGLTESEGATYTMQVSNDDDGRNWPLILGVAGGGAAAAAYFLLRDTNDPPSTGSISVNPASPGLVSVTNFAFNAQGASDPDNDALTYSWDFGDGQSASGQNTNHTFQSTGDFTVTLEVSDGEESASTSSMVTVRNLSASWGGMLDNVVSFGMDLVQSGTSISGTFRAFGDTGSVTGSVNAPSTVRMNVAIPGFQPFTMTGEISSDLNTISGTLQGSGFTGEPFTMSR